MFQFAQRAREAAEHLHLNVVVATPDERTKLLGAVQRRYGTLWPLWEHLREHVEHVESVRDAGAWRWLPQLLDGSRARLFFEPREEPNVFSCGSAEELVQLLGETYWSEFYVTDQEASYLICFNDHDVLIAAGAAHDRLRELLAATPGPGEPGTAGPPRGSGTT